MTYGHQPRRRGAGATGTVTAVLGFGMGGVAVSVPIVVLAKLRSGTALPGGAVTVLVLFASAGLVLLAGAVTTFRRPAGGL